MNRKKMAIENYWKSLAIIPAILNAEKMFKILPP